MMINYVGYSLYSLKNKDPRNDEYSEEYYKFYSIDKKVLKELLVTKHEIKIDSDVIKKIPSEWKNAFEHLTNDELKDCDSTEMVQKIMEAEQQKWDDSSTFEKILIFKEKNPLLFWIIAALPVLILILLFL